MVSHWLGHPALLCQSFLQTHSAACPDWLFLNCNEKKRRLSLLGIPAPSSPSWPCFSALLHRIPWNDREEGDLGEALGKTADTEPGCHL